MSLFQHSVLNKYLKDTNQAEMKDAYRKLVAYFHSPVIQQNIRECKEEEYQDGFLTALFVNVLGYTIKPNPDYNLTREFKNEKGAKKADGAILKDNAAIGVVELKSTTTKDLESIRLQAFDYKANQSKCVYVITSNFEKIRFYINNAVDFEEFDLFKINYEQFQLLWLCLAKDNLLKGIPLAIKEDSVIKEQDITKKIYLDYTAFKKGLYNDLIENNLDLEIFKGKDEKEIKLLLFKKSQKLIDRFLFIFFGEDRGLLPPNSISEIIKQWESQSDWGDEVHLYDRYRKYFHLLNTGWKGKQHEIFAYNGGLFAPDEVLDNVKISDEVLKKHTKVLTAYDFETEVDVNILGHIFENSLNEIEEVAAQIEGAEVDLKKSKRKKDGIFYTPKYITKYIVENTVGKLCKERKAELGILDFDYDRDFKLKTWRVIESVTEVKVKNEFRQVIEKRKTNISVEGTKQLEILNSYRDWLLKLTICDPACGSGAFLNQALDFLITEHNTVTELTQKITGDVSTMFIDIENQILEHNIYGVDINEESIEIAKLSLWLRTAQKGRKLTTLSNNIKCGNSLIDDPEVAGEKAFHWPTEFPEVFANGGFDVVIGNPPYVRADSPGNTMDFREFMVKSTKFETLAGKWDLYIPFIEQSIKLTNNKGKISLIIPDAYCHADYANKSLEWTKENRFLYQIDYFPEIIVFQNVGVKSVIVNFHKIINSKFNQRIHFSENSYKEEILITYPESMRIDSKQSILKKLSNFHYLNQICYSSVGIVGNSEEKKYKGEFLVGDLLSSVKDDMHHKLYFEGKDIGRGILLTQRWIEFGTERSPDKWRRKGFPEMFEGSPKLITMRSPGNIPRTMLDENFGYFNESAIGFKRWIDLYNINNNSLNKAYKNEEERLEFERISSSYSYPFLMAILNSSVIRYELNTNRRSNIHIYPEDWKILKIPELESNPELAEKIGERAEIMISLNKELQLLVEKFHRTIQRKFNLVKLTGKLQNWYLLSYAVFIRELSKMKIKLNLSEEAEWEDYFNEQKQKAQILKAEIEKTDREIDQMVYELYGLTEEEIGITVGGI